MNRLNNGNDVLFLTSEHLQSENKEIEDIWYRDFNTTQLPLKLFLDAKVVIYQEQTGYQETKILKSGTSLNGLLLNERLLEKEGWKANLETDCYEKEDEDFYLKLGKKFPLLHPTSNQQILIIQSIDVYDKVDNEIMCAVSTLEELRDVFQEDEFLYSAEDEERIPQEPEFALD